MRQRKLKNQEEKLIANKRYLIEEPEACKGRWREIFENENDIYIELGCGKGKFITTLAEKFPDRNYIGIEGQGSVILRALEKTEQKELANVRFIHLFAADVKTYFAADELAGIYLNFSDPWPKRRHEKKRLTHSVYLEGYRHILKPGGQIEFKTDNEELYGFTVKSVISGNMILPEKSEDLHHSALSAREITTEYEEKFKEMGRKIYYCKIATK